MVKQIHNKFESYYLSESLHFSRNHGIHLIVTESAFILKRTGFEQLVVTAFST